MKDPEFKIRKLTRRAITMGMAFIAAASATAAATPLGAQQLSQLSAASTPRRTYWTKLALGFGVSLFAHETAHILSSLAMGFHPYVGFDRGRPTIFSGIDAEKDPHKQFIFSAAGLTTQTLIDEFILDIPHTRGGAVERGILASGIGTTLFYITLGRNGAVSDVAYMARTSKLSKTQISLIFGGINALHALRISRDSAYRHFFLGPTENGVALGLRF